MTDLERLLAIEEIKQLQARRVRCVDFKDWKTYATLHSPDMQHDNDAFGGKVAGLDAVIERVKKAVERAVTIHHVHSSEIEMTSPTTAKGIWVLEDRLTWEYPEGGGKWKHGFGHYHDTYAKLNGAWVFTSRRFTRIRVEQGTIKNG